MTDRSTQQRLRPDKSAMETYPVAEVIDNSQTDFDLYVDTAGTLTLYAKAPYTWALGELRRLLDDGHSVLYYFAEDRERVAAYRLIHQQVKIDLSLPPPERLVGLTDAAAELTRILYNHPLTPAAMGKVGEVAKAMVSTVEEDPTCITALGKLANHDHYTYYHSARVSAYALAIAMQLSQKDQARLTEMATGALLHDVGKSKIQLDVLNKRGAFTQAEWDLMKQHPVFGEAIVADSLLAVVPREIILHHHEKLDGTGYPHQLSERELLEEVKIAAFADVFDALTTNRPYQVSRTPFEALDFIKHKLLKNMHKDSYQALVQLLSAMVGKQSA